MPDEKGIDVKGAREALEKDARRREVVCKKDLEALLEKHKCILVGIPVITEHGAIVSRAVVKAKPEQ